MKVSLILWLCIGHCLSLDPDFDIPEDWIDPTDMARFDYGTKTIRKDIDNENKRTIPAKEEPPQPPKAENHGENVQDAQPPAEPADSTDKDMKENVESRCEQPFLRRFVGVLQRQLGAVGSPPNTEDYELSVHLNSKDWLTLQEFADECQSAADVSHVLEDMITNVHVQLKKENTWKKKFEDIVQIPFEDCMKFGIVVLLAVSILTIEYLSQVSWSSQIKRLLIIAFLVSIGMTYFHELKLAEAEYKAKATDMPPECVGKKEVDSSYWQSIKSVYNDMFSVKKDPCEEYHANHLIGPHLKVTPTKVVAVTVTRFVVEPMEHIGTAFSKAFKNIFAGLPVTLWIPAFLFVILVVLGFLLIVAVCFGYNFSFNLPFWAGLQMGPQQAIHHNPEMDRVLEDNRRHIDQLHETIRELRERPQQQALPAPTVSPSGGRGILGFFGIGANRNTPPPEERPAPPAYPGQQPHESLPYPEFETPHYPPEELPFVSPGLRRRNTAPGTTHMMGHGAGDSRLRYPAEAPKPRSSSTSQLPKNERGSRNQNPIGFEHLLEDEEESLESKTSQHMTGVDAVQESGTTTVTRPVQEFPVHASTNTNSTQPKVPDNVAPEKTHSSSRKVKATPDSFLKRETQNPNLEASIGENQVETLPAEGVATVGSSDAPDGNLEGWEEICAELEGQHERCAGEKMNTMELAAEFEREAEEGFESQG